MARPAAPTCRVDGSVQRVVVGEFRFPLGVYPIEDMEPRAGYTIEFEPADGDDESGDWEQWPDRYVFDIVISSDRLEPLCRRLFSLMPGRVYPILDVLGHDAYRDIDPYISYELIGLDRFADALRRYRDFFFEDGLCGFGAMSEEPFVYVFVDEHKIATVRVEPDLKERVEKLLEAFDLTASQPGREPAGADASAHEHRGVLATPDNAPNLLSAEEIVERLRDEWQLVLNVDPEGNVDDDGKELGVTPWRCVVRCDAGADDEAGTSHYAEIIADAPCLRKAEETAFEATDDLAQQSEYLVRDLVMVASDRLTDEFVRKLLGDGEQRGTGRKRSGRKPKPEPDPVIGDAPAQEPREGKEPGTDEQAVKIRRARWLSD